MTGRSEEIAVYTQEMASRSVASAPRTQEIVPHTDGITTDATVSGHPVWLFDPVPAADAKERRLEAVGTRRLTVGLVLCYEPS
jgi:hypothetical protein